ncbi:DUF1579 family protein [Kocuria marina]|uniref:DUF1579 family protein n=1 Tax=Kocuria marina TaxID=223184 RepID=UPI0011A3C809|nr:DUF1579 family protein [Kocuria indica]
MSNLEATSANPEMERLAFLVGHWEGETIVHTMDGRSVPGRIRGQAQKILGGAWIEWSFEQDPNDVVERTQRGRYLFGWCPARGEYAAIYFDDRGNTLVEHSSDAVNSKAITFIGETVLTETGDVRFEDEISSDHADHFRNRVHMTIDGVRHLHGVFECRRTS